MTNDARRDRVWRARCLATLRTAPSRYARAVLSSERTTEAFLAAVWLGQRLQRAGAARPERDRAVSRYCALVVARSGDDPWTLAEQVVGGPAGEA